MPPAGGVTVQKKGVSHCKRAARRAAMLADCTAPSAALPRLALLYDLAYSYYPLLRSRWQLCCLTDAAHPLRVPLCSSRRSAEWLPSAAFGRQSAAGETSLAPHGSKARLKTVTVSRGSWRSHVHRTCTAQRMQSFKPQIHNVGGRGVLPSSFSGGYKGGILFEKRIPPLPYVPTAVGGGQPRFFSRERKWGVCYAAAYSAASPSARCADKGVSLLRKRIPPLPCVPTVGGGRTPRPLGVKKENTACAVSIKRSTRKKVEDHL